MCPCRGINWNGSIGSCRGGLDAVPSDLSLALRSGASAVYGARIRAGEHACKDVAIDVAAAENHGNVARQ